MKIHCPNFVPKSGCFYQILYRFVPNSCLLLPFKAILRLCLFVEIFASSAKKSHKRSTFALNFGLFHWKKVKTSLRVKNEKLVEF